MRMDSQVIDALHEGANLERLLQALGCDTSKDNGSRFESPGGFIHCPMPDHPDKTPSCTVRAAQGQLYCHSLCGAILPLDLVVAHGRATDRGGAAKFVEELLGLERRPAPPGKPMVDDPALTVEQYLGSKGLPAAIATKFGLEDVRVYQAGIDDDGKNQGGKQCMYPSGWYSAVFMPTRPGHRPRIRSDAPGGKLRWANRVRRPSGSMIDYSKDTSQPGPAVEVPLDAIGIAQLRPCTAGSSDAGSGTPALLLIVEGESDVHALHAMGIPWCVGVPGATMGRRVAPALLEACLIANGGDTNLASLTCLVWQEPGSAGSAFPDAVAAAVREAALQRGLPAPHFVPLHHGAVASAPKDPAALLLDRPVHIARAQIADALQRVCSVGLGDSGAAALAGPVSPTATPTPPAYLTEPPPARTGAAAAPWIAFDEIEDPPALDLAPPRIEGISSVFVRTTDGWALEKTDREGDTTLVPICSAFVVERVERCSGEILVRIAAPFGGAWNRVRLSMSTTADAGRTCAQLAQVGVAVANRQRPSVTDLLLALTVRSEQETGAVHVPAGTGWSGRPGTSPFGGIDVEPVNEFGARMFQSNVRRRELYPDTNAAAREWWDVALSLLEPPVGEPHASHAAPLLALGAAAAAPLIGPLAEAGVAVAPVVWIAGLGGGGKSVTQKLAAAIYAPSLPDLDGQSAYFANANISQAALSARVDSCRDLPLILDDVTQLPPLPGSTSRGDAARIEAAAALGMLVFNRKPIERATRDGGIRQTRAFRSSAIFSAEVSMSSETSKAVVTAGHRRRISTIEARPMTERGLAQAYAERVNDVSARVGGAPGELIVEGVRQLMAARNVRPEFDRVRRRLADMPEAVDVTMTQREAVAVNVLGFIILATECGAWSFDQALEFAVALLGPYFAAGAGAGGATRDSDLSGVDAALRAVDDLRAAHPLRFDSQMRDEAGLVLQAPMSGYLGKELRPLHDGTRRIAMLRPGMEMLNTRYGVTMQVIEQAVAEGRCQARKQIRMFDGSRVYATVWLIPPGGPMEPDDDPTEPGPHDPDPHGLLRDAPVYVPGAGALVEPELVAYVEQPVSEQAAIIPNDRWLALEHAIENDHASTITWNEGEYIMDARFQWGQGIYLVGDGPSMRTNKSLHVTIRREAVDELKALQQQYEPGVVAPMPADDDPRWTKIDAIGGEAARAQWTAMHEALYARSQQTDPEQRAAFDAAYVKAYRVHLMSRYRHPEWFILGSDVR